MRSFVIHKSDRTDRQGMVNALIRSYKAQPVEAVVGFGEDADARAVRGCALSHLSIIERAMSQLDVCAVFEDDAIPATCDEPFGPAALPDDCGALLVGGHAPRAVYHSPGLFQIIGRYQGTHAVVYNLKALKRTPFLLHAYRMLAGTKCGSMDGVIFESVLLSSLHSSGLKLLRLENMPFATNNLASDRGTSAPETLPDEPLTT